MYIHWIISMNIRYKMDGFEQDYSNAIDTTGFL